jgi:hypothetical protein
MKLCLVSAATATDFEDPAEANTPDVRKAAEEPHLGVLSLAAIMEARGAPPVVIDLNRTYYQYLDQGRVGLQEFAAWAAGVIVRSGAGVFGLSSILQLLSADASRCRTNQASCP